MIPQTKYYDFMKHIFLEIANKSINISVRLGQAMPILTTGLPNASDLMQQKLFLAIAAAKILSINQAPFYLI